METYIVLIIGFGIALAIAIAGIWHDMRPAQDAAPPDPIVGEPGE